MEEDFNIIGHLIFIGSSSYKKIEEKYNPYISHEGNSFEACTSEAIREDLRESLPEIEALHAFLEKDRTNLPKSENLTVYLVSESPNLTNLELISLHLESVGYQCKMICSGYNPSLLDENNEGFLKFKREIIQIRDTCSSFFFNLTNVNNNHTRNLIELAQEIDSNIYVLLENKDIMRITRNSGKFKQILEMDEKEDKDEYSYEELLLEKIKNRYQEQQSSANNYTVNIEGLSDVLSFSKKVEEDCLFLDCINKKNKNVHKAVKLLKLNGLTINPEKSSYLKRVYLNSVFEGLNSFNCSIIRIIMNNKNGINFYLGLICSKGDNSGLLTEIESQLSLLQKILTSILPGLTLEKVSGDELLGVLDFLNLNQQFGIILGYPTESVSNNLLRELENSLSKEQWGMITVATPLSPQKATRLIKELDGEIDIGIKNSTFSLGFTEEKKKSSAINPFTRIFSSSIRYVYKISKIKEYFASNRYSGLWDTGNYFFAKNEETYRVIYSILKANYKSKNPLWEPIRIIKLDNFLSQFPKNLQLINVDSSEYYISDELRPFQTIYDSVKLGDFIHLPSFTLKNFAVKKIPDFQTSFPKKVLDSMKYPIYLGEIINAGREKFYIDLNDLTRHCLIMGSTGSGKTNTILKILMFLKESNYNIPFLIIEPVKKEYRQILNDFDNLRIYTTGKKVNPLKINLFEVPPFLTYKQWINELLAIFNNTFYMWEPLIHILSNSLHEIYRFNGWSDSKIGRIPTLKEFVNYAKLKIDCSDYPPQNRSVYKGAVETRFETLLNGTRAITFNVHRSIPSFEEILENPTIIELDGLRNDDERSLIFNLLIRKLSLYHQERDQGDSLKHLIIIEEAHRFIKRENSVRERSEEGVKKKTQEIFSDFVSEVRGFGIGLIISDQKPFNLIDSAITNTDLKICHKLPSWHQIMAFKDSLGLSNVHSPIVSRLKQGECITKINQVDNPFYIQIDLIKEDDWGTNNKITDEVIKKRFLKEKILTQIHFTICVDNNEIFLKITELIYQGNQKQLIVKKPTKQGCLQFPNFKHLLWELIKNFYKEHKHCPNCVSVFRSNTNDKCPNCNGTLGKINTIKFPLFGEILLKSDFMTLIKLDELYTKRTKLIFSVFDRNSSKALNDLKEEFNQIISAYSEEHKNMSESLPISPSQKAIEKSWTLLGEDKSLVCNQCQNVIFKTKKIKLNLVRVSPQKLILLVSKLTIKCSNCQNEKILNYPSREIFNSLSDYENILKSEITPFLNDYLFCNKCFKYYRNLENCPTHQHPLQKQEVVVIRDLGRRFLTNQLRPSKNP